VAGYSIGALSRLTGLTPETLRAWERRYGVVTPQRDARGRTYSEEEVRKLRLLATLVAEGHAIGRIAGLSIPELESLEREGTSSKATQAPSSEPRPERRALTEALDRYDIVALEQELERMAALLSPRVFALSVSIPFLREIGEGWQTGRWSVAQEHLASAGVRSVLGTLMRLARTEGRTRVVFATPAGERHEFGLLSAALLSAAAGISPVYLGPDLPAEDIALAAERTGARAVVLQIVGAVSPQRAVDEVKSLVARMPRGFPVWVGGMAVPGLEEELAQVGARVLVRIEDVESALAALARG